MYSSSLQASAVGGLSLDRVLADSLM